MMNMRNKLSIFPHPQQFTLDPPPGGGDWSEAPRRLRRPVKKNTHIWTRPCTTGALRKARITHRNEPTQRNVTFSRGSL